MDTRTLNMNAMFGDERKKEGGEKQKVNEGSWLTDGWDRNAEETDKRPIFK